MPVKQIATLKAGQVAARYGEHAPMATACCNACRSCVQTNLLGIALGARTFIHSGRRGRSATGSELCIARQSRGGVAAQAAGK